MDSVNKKEDQINCEEVNFKKTIAKFILNDNYWGYLFSRIRRISTPELQSIAGVAPMEDGTVALLYNPNLLKNTSEEALLHVLEHEGMHILNKHITRFIRMLANEMNPDMLESKRELWNVAADCCVNFQANLPRTLHINGNDWKLHFPDLHQLPEKKAAEYYYEELFLRAKKNGSLNKNKNKNGNGQNGQNGNGSGNGNGDEKEEIIPGSSLNSKNGGMDDHSKWKDNTKNISDLSSMARKIDNYVGNIVRDSVRNFNRKRGHLPGHIYELIEEALKPPKAPYYEIIRQLVRASRLSKIINSPTKINRKRTYAFWLKKLMDDESFPVISPFPGLAKDHSFDVVILADTSMSMSKEDVAEALSGCKNIIEKDRYCTVTVIENDTDIKREYQIKKISDIKMDIKGRGGTRLQPGLDRSRELNADVVLCFTDGYCENVNALPKRMLPKKIIWVIQKEGTVDMVNRTGFIVRI